MITLRNFTVGDIPALQKHRYAHKTYQELQSLIDAWNTKEYEGKYFEMFAVIAGEEVVGSVSLYQHTKSIISCGPEMFADFLRRGYATCALNAALEIAKSKGYKIAVSQIRVDNVPSIALHEKLGFEKEDYIYKNRKGNDVYFFMKSLV